MFKRALTKPNGCRVASGTLGVLTVDTLPDDTAAELRAVVLVGSV
jgi:hypothetical protein